MERWKGCVNTLYNRRRDFSLREDSSVVMAVLSQNSEMMVLECVSKAKRQRRAFLRSKEARAGEGFASEPSAPARVGESTK